MYDQSYLKKSGQIWKFYLAAVVTLVGGALIWIGQSRLDAAGDSALVLMLVGAGMGVVGMVWSAVAVKCPKCGTRLLWRAVSEQSSGNWLTWLLHLDRCPSCNAT